MNLCLNNLRVTKKYPVYIPFLIDQLITAKTSVETQ